jgi:hypothetical protein
MSFTGQKDSTTHGFNKSTTFELLSLPFISTIWYNTNNLSSKTMLENGTNACSCLHNVEFDSKHLIKILYFDIYVIYRPKGLHYTWLHRVDRWKCVVHYWIWRLMLMLLMWYVFCIVSKTMLENGTNACSCLHNVEFDSKLRLPISNMLESLEYKLHHFTVLLKRSIK